MSRHKIFDILDDFNLAAREFAHLKAKGLPWKERYQEYNDLSERLNSELEALVEQAKRK